MTPDEISRALPSLGLVGTMGLFLPSLDEAWRVDPRKPSLYRVKLRRGETLYVALGGTILLLASYAARSTWPILVGGGMMVATVLTYENAFRCVPSEARAEQADDHGF